MSSRFQFPSFQESLILRRLFFSNGRLSITLVMSLVIFTLQNAAPYPCSLILKINNQNLSQWLFLWYFSRIKLIGSTSAASLETLDRWEDRHVKLLICCWKEHKSLLGNGRNKKRSVWKNRFFVQCKVRVKSICWSVSKEMGQTGRKIKGDYWPQ